MNNIQEQVRLIIFEEFSKLLKNIEGDFKKNYIKKNYNFLLNQLDAKTTANMVFVSSFESKSGFAIEACAKRIARIRYGEKNVPTIVNPNNLEHTIDEKYINGQIIVTDINIEDGNLKGEISAFRANNISKGKGKAKQTSTVNQTTIKSLLDTAKKYKTSGVIYTKPVDLAFFDGVNWNIMELKAGGDLDSSNAPSNVEKLLTIYTGLNYYNTKVFFATLYNKDGEGNTWTGAVKKHLAYPEMFLIGKNFWEYILPEEINFEEFTKIYKETLSELDLNNRINEMIKGCLQ